jgi:hypothetical protein
MKTFFRASFHSLIAMLALVSICSLMLGACATNGKPDVTVASTGTTVLAAATELTNGVTTMVEGGLIPKPTGAKIADQMQVVHDKAAQLSDALKAYHAATTPLDQQSKGALVQALLTQLTGPLAAILNINVPDGTVQRLNALVGRVLQIVALIQGEVAKGLGGGGTSVAIWRPGLVVA